VGRCDGRRYEISFPCGRKSLQHGYHVVLLVIGALGPANWTPRTALGWQIDHFLGYFAITIPPEVR
jgi:hypothetical protein